MNNKKWTWDVEVSTTNVATICNDEVSVNDYIKISFILNKTEIFNVDVLDLQNSERAMSIIIKELVNLMKANGDRNVISFIELRALFLHIIDNYIWWLENLEIVNPFAYNLEDRSFNVVTEFRKIKGNPSNWKMVYAEGYDYEYDILPVKLVWRDMLSIESFRKGSIIDRITTFVISYVNDHYVNRSGDKSSMGQLLVDLIAYLLDVLKSPKQCEIKLNNLLKENEGTNDEK